MDFDFFGNQISAHNTGTVVPTQDTALVESKKVPMPHFGAVLEWKQFQEIADRLRSAQTRFLIEPMLRYEGKPGEQLTMFLLDPSGNALEFKAYRNESGIFAA